MRLVDVGVAVLMKRHTSVVHISDGNLEIQVSLMCCFVEILIKKSVYSY